MAGLFSGSSTSGSATNQYIMAGPTPAAAAEAASAQIGASQLAAQAVTQNTTSAIDALMGEYQTSVQLLTPSINTGNQAAAQMNYMLGLPAVNPGAAPVAPTAPTLAGQAAPSMSTLTNELSQYLNPVQASTGALLQSYNGPDGLTGQAANASTSAGQYVANTDQRNYVPLQTGTYLAGSGSQAVQELQTSDPAAYQDLVTQAQQGELATANQNYSTQNALYQTQDAAYNAAEANYQTYKAKGTASASDISNIISNQPGFQFAQNQGIAAIQNAGSASGELNSGNILQSLDTFGQNLSQTYYQNYMGNLASLVNSGQAATGQASSLSGNVGQQLASQYTNQGAGIADSALAAGAATASSYTNTPTNQQMIANPYSTSSSSQSAGTSGGSGLLSSLIGGLL